MKNFNTSRFVAGFLAVGVPGALAGTLLVQQAADAKARGFETAWHFDADATYIIVCVFAGLVGFVWARMGD